MRFILFLSLPLFAIDQFTKYLIVKNFPDPASSSNYFIEVIPGFFHIVRVHNTGMAFGLLNGSPIANLLFGAIGIAALTIIGILWKRNAFPDKITKTAAALLVAGILGNFTDRILPGRGYVVDFLDFQPPFYGKLFPSTHGHFAVFNVADSCICIAAGLLIISSFIQAKKEKQRQND